MGVKPFLVASSIQAVMAQRLIRIICDDCKEEYPDPDPRLLRLLGFRPEELKGHTFYRGRGCNSCGGTGYHGRQGIFELMQMDTAMRELAFNRAPLNEMRKAARASGMRGLLEDGRMKIMAGRTTPEELVQITQTAELTGD
jgi:type IV pilus assembly protein PilB